MTHAVGRPIRERAVAFVARSGTGKTTLIESVIRELKDLGVRVGALKHDAHDFSIDRPGKDSFRFTAAGASTMVIASKTQVAMVKQTEHPWTVDQVLERCFDPDDVDLVLVEGWKTSDLPKIEVDRAELGTPLLTRGEHHDPNLIAVATNATESPALPAVDVPVLNLNRPEDVAQFLVDRFLS